ncbi:MAG: helix-turn-helix domain-containing protein [Candidatus Aminicenantales bacterium]
MSRFFTLNEVCEKLGVTRKTALNWIKTGELKAFKLGSGGRLWRVRERDLQAFIRNPKA